MTVYFCCRCRQYFSLGGNISALLVISAKLYDASFGKAKGVAPTPPPVRPKVAKHRIRAKVKINFKTPVPGIIDILGIIDIDILGTNHFKKTKCTNHFCHI